MNKEQVYDEQINPLVAQILEICKTHGIAMIASFHIPTPEQDDLACTSLLPDEHGENGPRHKEAFRVLKGAPSIAAFTITSREPTNDR